jgi:hypothetical protein
LDFNAKRPASMSPSQRKRIYHTDSLLPPKYPPCCEMMEFFSIAELQLLFDPGSIIVRILIAETLDMRVSPSFVLSRPEHFFNSI